MPKIEVYPLVIKIGKAIIITIKIAILSLIIGLVLSLVFWLLLILNSVTRTITSFITSIVRSIPELVTIMFTYFVLPVLIQKIFPSYSISPICSTSIGLALIFASYASKIFYEFYNEFPSGQVHAALSLSIPYKFIFLRIKMPQILKNLILYYIISG